MDAIRIYKSAFDICAAYDADTQARLVGYMAMYALTGNEPQFADSDPARYVWPALKEKADRTCESYEQKASAGRAGGNQRASNAQAEVKQTPSTSQAEVKQTESTEVTEVKPETDTDTNTDTETDKDINVLRAREAKKTLMNRFERVWAAYPRKVAKPQALKAFEKVKPDEDLLAAMLEALERWKASDQWTRDGGQYIPHPATWLNQRRWEDEVPKPVPVGKPERRVNAQQYEQRDYSGENDDEEMARMVLRNAASARQSGVDVDTLARKYPEIAKKYGVEATA